ncbi:hypothetical protein GCM10007977_089720 [Dactylosporangium sucinum]|uniref:Uncharacterized protein n=1 Tax=Dactylosporangium sucinum TaxID=1424081 RepID=A0A917UB21_9ACTN|nr:hypothetical protein GCM10007977_089720 [Dactylosporangium sucinum]
MLGHGQAVHAGQIDVEQRDVRLRPRDGGDGVVASLDGGDHSHIVFQLEDRRQRLAKQADIFRDHHSDHVHSSRGTAVRCTTGRIAELEI